MSSLWEVTGTVEGEPTKGCPCGCTQKFSDLLRAAQPNKKTSLIRVFCSSCGRVFLSNFEKEYCFDCEVKK